MTYCIVDYSDKYWDQFVDLINLFWRNNHPIVHKELFDWQYEGYGEGKGVHNSQLTFIDNKLVGFRGTIPEIYQVPSIKNEKGDIVTGYSLALWLVHPDYKGKGLGGGLLNAVSNRYVLKVLGANLNTSFPIFQKRGFAYLEALNRYVIPLRSTDYIKLLSDDVKVRQIDEWMEQISEKSNENYEEPIIANSEKLEQLWEKSTNSTSLFSLLRNKEFWQWRYINSVGFKYLFFGDYDLKGIIVARIEKVYSPENPATNGLKVLRIIEIIPALSNVWEGNSNKLTENLLTGTLKWGKVNGCCAADYQCSNSRLEKLLYKVGFRKQNSNYGPPLCSLAGLFQPLVYKPAPINALWKITDSSGEIRTVNIEDTYFVKSDSDMDRPNIWPVYD